MLIDAGFRDTMHDFVDKQVPTMHKSKKFRAWRPDKVVMLAAPTNTNKAHWKVTSAEILGKDALPSYAEKNESPE